MAKVVAVCPEGPFRESFVGGLRSEASVFNSASGVHNLYNHTLGAETMNVARLKPMLRLRRAIGVTGIVGCICLLGLPTNVMSMSTTYQLFVGGTGTFTLDEPVGSATAFLGWDLDFSGLMFNSDTDQTSTTSSTGAANLILDAISQGGNELLFVLSKNMPGLFAVSTGPVGMVDESEAVTGIFVLDQSSQVPEPSTALLITTGLLGLAGYRWSQRRRERLQAG